jgi:hypothetical protein
MFLKSDYRDRGIGLIAAFAVLITGAISTGAITPAPVKAIDALPRTSPLGGPEAKTADDCSSGLRCKCDTYC